MDDIVGIALGTTNSLIGIMEAGFPILLADANGERLTPSVVHIPKTGEPLVGQAAARMRAIDPGSTIYSIKRFNGLRGRDVRDEDVDVDYRLTRHLGAPLRVQIGAVEYAPEEISAFVLRKLKQDAENALGRSVSRAVITVPAYFNDAQRTATKKAGDLAGFLVERIVNEPTAAALAYGLDRSQSKSRIAVYDLGGGTFDISILELKEGIFEVLATNGNTRLGGDDIDNALCRSIVARFCESPSWKHPAAETTALQRLREGIVDAKHRLSIEEKIGIEIPFFDGAKTLPIELSRKELENIARPTIERTRLHCLRALADARVSPGQLDDVILVGGVTRMPLVRRYVAEIFGRQPNVSQNPDEAVAIGATIQAGILSGAVQEVVLLDVTPLSLGIETFGGLMNVIIPRNSTIPMRAGEMFTTAVHNQRSMSIKVLQGEREMARDNWRLGEFEIEFEPAPKGVPRVGVQFEIDANGILQVLARDIKSGNEKIIEVKSAVDVTDEAVESMLAESLDHAFADVGERIWIETKLKSEEMLAAVESGLGLVGDQIGEIEKKRILDLAAEVRRKIDSHQTQKLKEANEALDSATQNLAAVIVEKAMTSAAGNTRAPTTK